jgi:hypothetical protein
MNPANTMMPITTAKMMIDVIQSSFAILQTDG